MFGKPWRSEKEINKILDEQEDEPVEQTPKRRRNTTKSTRPRKQQKISPNPADNDSKSGQLARKKGSSVVKPEQPKDDTDDIVHEWAYGLQRNPPQPDTTGTTNPDYRMFSPGFSTHSGDGDAFEVSWNANMRERKAKREKGATGKEVPEEKDEQI